MTTSAQILLPDNASILLPSDGAPDSILGVLANVAETGSISVASIRDEYLKKYSAPVLPNIIPYIEIEEGDAFNANWYYTLNADNELKISTNWPEGGDIVINSPYLCLESMYDELIPEVRARMSEAIAKLIQNEINIPGVSGNPSEMVYMTNMCCEVATVTPAQLDGANLPYQTDSTEEGSFYPLTSEEERFIAEDMTYVNGDRLCVYMSQTVLYKSQKYMCLTHSEHYGEDQTKSEAGNNHRKALVAALSLSSTCNGIVTWTNEPDYENERSKSSPGCGTTSGEYSTFILIPFSAILKNNHSYDSFWESLKPAF